MATYSEVFIKLNEKQIKYLIVGGFAVNFHQVQRATVDLDLVILLETENILKFNLLMKELNYSPKLPVNPNDLAKKEIRNEWFNDRNMLVLSFIKAGSPFEIIDVFINEPMPFKDLWKNRMEANAFNTKLPVIGLNDLITLKKQAGRDKDEYDIKQLQKIKN